MSLLATIACIDLEPLKMVIEPLRLHDLGCLYFPTLAFNLQRVSMSGGTRYVQLLRKEMTLGPRFALALLVFLAFLVLPFASCWARSFS